MSTYKDVKEIKKIYDCGGYFSHMPIPKKVPADYIFDENISVKRNRDMVQKHNENVQKLKEEKRGQNDILHGFPIRSIVNSWFWRNLNKYHSHMPDYFAEIDKFAEVVFNIIND